MYICMCLIKCGQRIKVLYYLHPLLGRGGRDLFLLFIIISGLRHDAARETPLPCMQQKPSVMLLWWGWAGTFRDGDGT